MEEIDLDEAKRRLTWYDKTYGPYIEHRSLKNWKNLFRKPTAAQWLILFLLSMVITLGYVYVHDTETCRVINEQGGAQRIYYLKNQTNSTTIQIVLPNISIGGSLDRNG